MSVSLPSLQGKTAAFSSSTIANSSAELPPSSSAPSAGAGIAVEEPGEEPAAADTAGAGGEDIGGAGGDDTSSGADETGAGADETCAGAEETGAADDEALAEDEEEDFFFLPFFGGGGLPKNFDVFMMMKMRW